MLVTGGELLLWPLEFLAAVLLYAPCRWSVTFIVVPK
jgi:hypothetical protein